MSGPGMKHMVPRFRGMNQHRNHNSTVKVEEKRLQKLLDFIDTRMQDQRSKLKRQMEDTQQAAEEMEEKRHKATLQLLKSYFEVTSGRGVGSHSTNNPMHEERMMGVLSEPSLATVPEVDPDVLSKPRSMYDRITRSFDTSRLPMIPPNQRNIINQPKSLPATMPNSNRSDSTSDDGSTRVVITPLATPRSTPHHTPTSSNEDVPWNESPKKPMPITTSTDKYQYKHSQNKFKDGDVSPLGRNGHSLDLINGHTYQKGTTRPVSKVHAYEDLETPTPRLGDMVSSKRGVSRHLSLRRTMGTSTGSTISLSELQPTRKQQAANKLKHALKTVRVPR